MAWRLSVKPSGGFCIYKRGHPLSPYLPMMLLSHFCSRYKRAHATRSYGAWRPLLSGGRAMTSGAEPGRTSYVGEIRGVGVPLSSGG